eukprot:TRINITY_DN28714_c0_g1_i2.p1 TRINITY_DN28714_c0_g1~~TRINITY_DN28714_c0_g1_i2.p1  ORF type:complete len:216 (-),score=44.02 TRINITY_DN28714_c0_g1_i2:24-635(-)
MPFSLAVSRRIYSEARTKLRKSIEENVEVDDLGTMDTKTLALGEERRQSLTSDASDEFGRAASELPKTPLPLDRSRRRRVSVKDAFGTIHASVAGTMRAQAATQAIKKAMETQRADVQVSRLPMPRTLIEQQRNEAREARLREKLQWEEMLRQLEKDMKEKRELVEEEEKRATALAIVNKELDDMQRQDLIIRGSLTHSRLGS